MKIIDASTIECDSLACAVRNPYVGHLIMSLYELTPDERAAALASVITFLEDQNAINLDTFELIRKLCREGLLAGPHDHT